jgi:hypothetical protein
LGFSGYANDADSNNLISVFHPLFGVIKKNGKRARLDFLLGMVRLFDVGVKPAEVAQVRFTERLQNSSIACDELG